MELGCLGQREKASNGRGSQACHSLERRMGTSQNSASSAGEDTTEGGGNPRGRRIQNTAEGGAEQRSGGTGSMYERGTAPSGEPLAWATLGLVRIVLYANRG